MVPLVKPNNRKNGTLMIKELLRNPEVLSDLGQRIHPQAGERFTGGKSTPARHSGLGDFLGLGDVGALGLLLPLLPV